MQTQAKLAERPHTTGRKSTSIIRLSPIKLPHSLTSCHIVNRYAKPTPWAGRARAGPGPDSTIKSLESILGSQDDGGKRSPSEDEGAAPRQRYRPEAAARRVRPLYVYVIYYCFIVVYLAAAWLQATEGDLAASTLVDGLVNDHLAVASGQVPRLATAGFVCAGPLQLFMQLATLLTVGAEAEALLGYSLFWAVYWLANLGGGLADAALSELPLTYGPANAAAGMVGALVAFYVRNLGLEERIEAARTAVRLRRRQILDGCGTGEDEEEGGTSSRSPLLPVSSRDSIEDAEAEVEVLPLLSFKFSARLSTEARGLLNVLVALVVAGQGLLEFGDADSSASWIGLISAFWTGLVLTFGAGPQYEVKYSLPPIPRESAGAAADRASGDGQPPTAGSRDECAWPPDDTADLDGLTVVDVCPMARRQAVLGGYVAALAALICLWLVWMGTDIW